jgi:CRP-like cAMP-binding protein
VPNSTAGRERLEIYPRSGPPIARTLHVALEYDASPSRARDVLEGALRSQPGLAARPEPVAYLKSFDDFAVRYELRYWLEDYGRLLEVDARVRERVWYALGRAGLGFAFPLIRQHQWAAGPLLQVSRREAILSVISRIDLFTPLSDAERATLAERALERHYAADEIVVRERESGTSMFLVESGRLSVSIHGASGSQEVSVLEPGSAFGEISLLTGEPRSATVRSINEVALIEIDKATLAPILEANPSLVNSLEETMRARQRTTAELLDAARVAQASAPEPLALAARIARFFGLA